LVEFGISERLSRHELLNTLRDRVHFAFKEFIEEYPPYELENVNRELAEEYAIHYVLGEMLMRAWAGQDFEEAWFEVENGALPFSLEGYMIDSIEEARTDEDEYEEDE